MISLFKWPIIKHSHAHSKMSTGGKPSPLIGGVSWRGENKAIIRTLILLFVFQGHNIAQMRQNMLFPLSRAGVPFRLVC